MMAAADAHDLDGYMLADHQLDLVTHLACGNHSTVKCMLPLVVQCRRFWYPHEHEGEIKEGAAVHMELAKVTPSGDESAAVAGTTRPMD